MGRYFLERTGVIADIIEQGETIIRKQLGLSLRVALASEAFPEALLAPITTVTQIALTAEWRERGLNPSALVGRCAGEFAAAHASGALSFEDALDVPCRIARVTNSGRGRGKLIVVDVTCEEAMALSADCPVRYAVVSEANEAMAVVGCAVEDAVAVEAFFAGLGIATHATSLIVAWHTWLIDEMRDAFLRPLSKPAKPACLPIHSATARGPLPQVGDWALHYWTVVRHDLSVRAAIGSALDSGVTCFVEVGGQPTLRAFIESEANARRVSVTSHATMERNRPLQITMDETLTALGRSRSAR